MTTSMELALKNKLDSRSEDLERIDYKKSPQGEWSNR